MIRFKIGTKAVFLIIFFLALLWVALSRGVLELSYLRDLNLYVVFFSGIFAVFMGSAFYYFWLFKARSKNRFLFTKGIEFIHDEDIQLLKLKDFRITLGGNANWDAFELNYRVAKILSIGSFLLIGLLTLHNRSFSIISKLPENANIFASRYCPEKDDEPDYESEEMMGCKLLVKAFKLGYAKDLGPCEPKKKDPENLKICTMRRKGEPYLHYMARQVSSFVGLIGEALSSEEINKTEKKFKLQYKNIEIIKDYQNYAMNADPRSSHHVFTNLKYPGSIFEKYWKKIFSPSGCIEKFQNQTNVLGSNFDPKYKKSKSVEHALGHLLFNSRVKTTVGFCKEYTVHWGQNIDACEKLSRKPQEFLEEVGSLKEVQKVLNRRDNRDLLAKMEQMVEDIEFKGLTEEQIKKKWVKGKINKRRIKRANEIVSFQCFFEGEDEEIKLRSHQVKLNGNSFLVRDMMAPKMLEDFAQESKTYHQLAKLLQSRFQYTKFDSLASLDVSDETDEIKNTFLNKYFVFSKLDVLNSQDIFLAKSWVYDIEGLFEVYPFHVHLKNFVEIFRKDYKKIRGRL